MDLSSELLNLSGIEILRGIVKKSAIYSSIIPSSASIWAVQSKLKIYSNELIPYALYETTTGEGIEFN